MQRKNSKYILQRFNSDYLCGRITGGLFCFSFLVHLNFSFSQDEHILHVLLKKDNTMGKIVKQ